MKSLGPEHIFHSTSAIQTKKLTSAVCLFKIESVLSKSLKMVQRPKLLSTFELVQHMGDEKIFSGPKLIIFVKIF